MLTGIIVGVSIAILAIVYTVLKNVQVRKLLISLDDMLDCAVNGKIPESYNDTLKSAMEHKLLKYIAIAESEKQRFIKDKEQVRSLISDISHQTKTSVANIKVYSQLLVENIKTLNDGASTASEILKQSLRLEFLIDSLIKMSRLESGILQMKQERVLVSELISVALSPVFMKTDKKGIAVIADCGEDITLCCDKKWTAEAIGNIIDNAIKYSCPQNGKILISAKKLEMYTIINIEDNGIGINEKETNDIFKRFYRGNNTASEDGIGIGLYISREIMNAQGGYITASSKTGTTVFSVFIYNQVCRGAECQI